MHAGDILLFHRGGFIARIIQWGTSSKYSHVALCVSPRMSLLIEAQGRVRANDIRKMREYDIYRIKHEHNYDLAKVVSFLVSKLNRKYDYLGVIYLGFLKVLGQTKRANAWQRKNDYFCSELVWEAFNIGGLDICPDVSDGSIVSPGDIASSVIVERIKREEN